METTTPKPSANVGTLDLTKPPGATPVDSTKAPTLVADTVERAVQDPTATAGSGLPQTSRFPTRARNAGREGQTDVETKSQSFSSQGWAESARNAVRDHPLAVVGVALIAGLLVGRL